MRKVVLVDDHPIFRDGVKQTLAATEKFSVVFETTSVESLSSYLEKNRNQLSDIFFIIDISLPDGNGFELLPLIAEAGGLTQQCTVLSMHDDYEYAEHAFALNAYGYVAKSDDPENIVTCLESLEAGKPYISPGVRKGSQKEVPQERNKTDVNTQAPAFSLLSKRELDILKLVSEGKTSKEISEELFLSQRTVENHRAKIGRKLEVSGPNGLISIAIKYKKLLTS